MNKKNIVIIVFAVVLLVSILWFEGIVIGPKYLPISLGQGMNAIIEKYQEKYSENTNEDNLKEKEPQVIETINTTFETYYKMSDGTWQLNGNSYKYRLEVTGRMPNAVMDSTFVYLSNIEDIPFERAYLAAGLSSITTDYYPVEDAVLVDYFNIE